MVAVMQVVDTLVTVLNVVLGWQLGQAWRYREWPRAGWLLVAIICFAAFYIGLRIGYSVWTAHHGAH